jgi:serine/threonine-protein kinase
MEIVTDDLPVLDFPDDPDGTGVHYELAKAEVPDVVGELVDGAEAIRALKTSFFRAGLDVAIDEVPSTEEAGTVLATSPGPGERIGQGTVVSVQISSGKPPTIELPAFAGMTLEEVDAELARIFEEEGVTINWTRVNRRTNNPNQVGKVIGTNPGAGKIVRDGQTIRVIVGIRQGGGGGGQGGGNNSGGNG